MALHDYQCKKCGKYFEVSVSIMETKKVHCPHCKSVRLKKLYTTPPTIRFVGKGFYSTDHKR